MTDVPAPHRTSGQEAATSGGFRADIQALRAIAVLSVLAYHLYPNRVTGGFVGVDVFFVISGYLITSHLLRERARTGRIAVGAFWARRAARLLPASLLVLLVSAFAVIAWVPRALWPQFLSEVAASALYVQNWRLLSDSVDYLAADNQASPVQHFWTLSAEEQFYVMLPLLVLAAMWVFRRYPWRAVFTAAIGVATLVSFGYSVWLMTVAPSHAYFSTFSRAWEFGLGALLSLVPALRSRRLSNVLALTGVLGVLVSVFLYTGETSFPGATALLPVVGTALAIWGGRGSALERVGQLAPVSMLGRVSYAIYLWHWPLIVIVPFVTGVPLTTLHKLAIAAASIVLAWVSTTYFEDVVRGSRRLLRGRRPRTVALWSALGMVVVLVASAGSLQIASSVQSHVSAQKEADLAADEECFGAAAMLASDGECAPSTADRVVPDQFDLLADNGRGYDCYTTADATTVDTCRLGSDRDDALRVAIVGNSHAAMFVEALWDELDARNWRLDTYIGNGCEWGEVDASPVCGARLAEIDEALLGGEPYDVLLTTTRRASTEDPTVVENYTAAWSALEARGTQVIVISDNPGISDAAAECIRTESLTAVVNGECDTSETEGYARPDLMLAAAEESGGRFDVVDLRDLFCADGTCPAVIGNVIVYRDSHHVTATYIRSVAPFFLERLRSAITSTG